jgi:hypothetical protein
VSSKAEGFATTVVLVLPAANNIVGVCPQALKKIEPISS